MYLWPPTRKFKQIALGLSILYSGLQHRLYLKKRIHAKKENNRLTAINQSHPFLLLRPTERWRPQKKNMSGGLEFQSPGSESRGPTHSPKALGCTGKEGTGWGPVSASEVSQPYCRSVRSRPGSK